ncbi:ribosome modulation factor [Methylobacterium planeticum]|uniref:Ribosome modulation factor n=1 Tax=Methylobacterium planeticum TaxID=2615211 RepID=A0A6N6MQ14_9HYPH|nr:hypothetical protein [Methylobacterium planeticum]KAB1072108.1 hypothetical protein F6X51_16905 [Methylobacterium planeticum]
MTRTDTSPASVREDGRHARDRGDPADANPHPPGSAEHDLWRRGWERPDDEGNAAGKAARGGEG